MAQALKTPHRNILAIHAAPHSGTQTALYSEVQYRIHPELPMEHMMKEYQMLQSQHYQFIDEALVRLFKYAIVFVLGTH